MEGPNECDSIVSFGSEGEIIIYLFMGSCGINMFGKTLITGDQFYDRKVFGLPERVQKLLRRKELASRWQLWIQLQ